jgi:hypothetical protein
MDKKQKDLLEQLAKTLRQIEDEATRDDGFHCVMYSIPGIDDSYDNLADIINSLANPMPAIKVGDFIAYGKAGVAVCVYGNIVRDLITNRHYNFGGEIKENTIAIERYDPDKGRSVTIWSK